MKGTLLIRTFVLAVSFHASLGFAMETSDQDYYRVIMINGEDIPVAQGKEISSLSLFAVKEGMLEPIPYQIDEYNIGGAVYFAEWHEPIDGTPQLVDPNDKLLFLMGDSGERKTKTMRADGKIISEIEINTSTNTKRYVYLVEGSRLQSDAQHVRYSIEESAVETDFFSLDFNKDNHLIWNDFAYADYRGDSPIDGLKIKFTSGIISSAAEMSFDNESFIAKTAGENVGPIRTTIQLHFTFIYLGLEFIDASIQAHFYPNAFIYDVRLMIPEIRRALLVDPNMSVAIDFNQLIGAQIVTDSLSKPLVVDGNMTEEEKAANHVELNKDTNGILLRSNRGFDLLAYLDWGITDPLPTKFMYQDNDYQFNKSDRFAGQLPITGYHVSDFPDKGLFGLIASVYFADYFKGTPRELSKLVRTSPPIKINNIASTNNKVVNYSHSKMALR